jgi:hypothetical protein
MFKWFREFETKLKKKKKKTIVTQTCPKLNYLASGCRQDEEIK